MTHNNNWRAVAEEELRFFGDVSASISHEINNRFAVISEKAGLIEDLAVMLARGKDVDPNRFESQGSKIVDQVRKAEHVVRNLNRFSHSADVSTASIDFADLIAFVVDLYSRKSAMAEVTLTVTTPARPITIRASPFILENLVGRCLDIALLQSSNKKIVNIEAGETAEGLTVRFGELSEFSIGPAELDIGLSALLECVHAGLRSADDGRTMVLDIPKPNRSNQGENND